MKEKYRRITHKSKYKYVHGHQNSGYDKITWYFRYPKLSISKPFNSEKEAALEGDKLLINLGEEPVNILVKKDEKKELLYSIKETTEKLNICEPTLRRYRSQGKIIAREIAGRVYYSEYEISKLLKLK